MRIVKSLIGDMVSFVVWVVIIISVVYLICDIYTSGDALVREYMSMDSQQETVWSKSAFLTAYKESLRQEDTTVLSTSYAAFEGVNIDTSLFTEASVSINTQIYGIAESLIREMSAVDMEELDSNSDENYVYFLEHLNPIMLLAPLNTEIGNLGNKAYTWAPAIYSKVLVENGIDLDSPSFNVDDVNFRLFATNSNLALYLSCGSNCNRMDGSAISVSELVSSGGSGPVYEKAKSGQHLVAGNNRNYNDNDSLGPLQILRRYLYGAGGELKYTKYGKVVSDLMRWNDNVVYWYCSYIPKIKGNTWRDWDSNYTVSSEYEMVMLLAIGHNAGPSLYSRRATDRTAYSRFKDVGEALKWVKFVMECEERTGVLQECVDSWYESNFGSDRDPTATFSMPSDLFSVGTTTGRASLAKLFGQNSPCNRNGQHEVDCSTASFIIGDACVFTGYGSGSQSFAGAHKAVYPIKALVDYMALVKLYTSGGADGETN